MNLNFACVAFKDEKDKPFKDVVWEYIQVFIAEFIGTGYLLFFGCGSGAAFYTDGIIGETLMFGLAVATIVQVIAIISSGHINPIVSICFWILGRISLPMTINYMVAQFTGALGGYLLIWGISKNWAINVGEGRGNHFCCTLVNPRIDVWQGAAMEYIISTFLVLTVCSALDPRNATKHDSIAIKFGLMIFIVAYIGAPYTGASLNPARTFAPALIMNKWDNIWVYMIMPPLASIVTTVFYYIMFMPKSDSPAAE